MTGAHKGSELPPSRGLGVTDGRLQGPVLAAQEALAGFAGGREDVGEASKKGLEGETGSRATDTAGSDPVPLLWAVLVGGCCLFHFEARRL